MIEAEIHRDERTKRQDLLIEATGSQESNQSVNQYTRKRDAPKTKLRRRGGWNPRLRATWRTKMAKIRFRCVGGVSPPLPPLNCPLPLRDWRMASPIHHLLAANLVSLRLQFHSVDVLIEMFGGWVSRWYPCSFSIFASTPIFACKFRIPISIWKSIFNRIIRMNCFHFV